VSQNTQADSPDQVDNSKKAVSKKPPQTCPCENIGVLCHIETLVGSLVSFCAFVVMISLDVRFIFA
jgi:hypothetical protein